MEVLRKARGIVRSNFTRTFNKLDAAISDQVCDHDEVQVRFELLSQYTSKLEELDQKIGNLLLEENADENILNIEQIQVEEYQEKFIKAKIHYSRSIKVPVTPISEASFASVDSEKKGIRKSKLPKIELPKFNGDLKGWLSFWSQFQKVHSDNDISAEDKFQYLIQSMTPGSRAFNLVNSYPPTANNYSKAIEGLQNRFGNKDMLVEVYVRELLQLVISNMTKSSNSDFEVALLYDKLESHLRALESLGVTKESCTPMLFPLVESSLPEELLRTWQRCGSRTGVDVKDRLIKLMEFLESEAHNEERVNMALKGFSLNNDEPEVKKTVKTQKIYSDVEQVPTASNLLSEKIEISCLFCAGKHESSKCLKAKKQSYDERVKIVKEKKACSRCLKIGHGYWNCWAKVKCDDCGKRHFSLMCRNRLMSNIPQEVVKAMAGVTVNEDVFLQTLRVKLEFGGKTKTVRAIIDSGSQYSYILRDLAKEMNYEPLSSHTMQHGLFGGSTSLPETHHKYKINVKNLLSSYVCDIDVFDKNIICSDIPTISDHKWLEKIMKNHYIFLTDNGQKEHIKLLIGADMIAKLLTGNVVMIDANVTAIETHLGWTLIGRKTNSTCDTDTALLVVSLFVNNANVSDLWKLDVIGISDPIETSTKEMHLQEVKNNFINTMMIDDNGRYEVPLPWKQNHRPLIENRNMCLQRLTKVTERLKHENYFDIHNKVFADWLSESIIEKVPVCEYNDVSYYLPHRHVVRLSSSTTPIRPVFDASAHVKDSASLNECLETGPNLIELIPNILLRFRNNKIGVVSDIRKAFLMISIRPKDRNFLRFLWWDINNPNHLQVYRHSRVVFGLTSSPFILGATIELHLNKALESATTPSDRMMISKLKKSYYVDNCVTSVSNETQLTVFRDTAIKIMASGGFNLRCWEHTGQTDTSQKSSVLGMLWDKLEDTLSLKEIPSGEFPEIVTKRFVLSSSHKIFDCLGIVCPVLVYPKLLLRKLSASESWDTPIGSDDQKAFVEWYSQLYLLKEIKIPRWMFDSYSDITNVSFHVFVDASLAAYAAVVYIRIENGNNVTVRFVQAKSRMTPMTSTTIPRLELLAATIGVRLLNSIVEALDCKDKYEIYYWSDSTTVISWIKRDWQWRVFVQNRVKEIRTLSKPEQWHYVPGELNPADLPSRGCDAKFLIKSKWCDGPVWLKHARDRWFAISEFIVDESEVHKEKKNSEKQTNKINNDVTLLVQDTTMKSYWYSHYFSSYNKIIRMIGWIKRFIVNCRSTRTVRTRSKTRLDLSSNEYKEAEMILLRTLQNDIFSGPLPISN